MSIFSNKTTTKSTQVKKEKVEINVNQKVSLITPFSNSSDSAVIAGVKLGATILGAGFCWGMGTNIGSSVTEVFKGAGAGALKVIFSEKKKEAKKEKAKEVIATKEVEKETVSTTEGK
jgi:hypothetical protein